MFTIIKKGQQGIALIELAVVLLLTGIIGSGASVAIIQTITTYNRDNARVQMSENLSMMTRYLQNDVQMAKYICVPGQSAPVTDSSSHPFPVLLERFDWNDIEPDSGSRIAGSRDEYQYDIDPATMRVTRTFRHYDSTGNLASTQTITVACNIDAANSTWCVMNAMFSANITAAMNGGKYQSTTQINILIPSAR